MSGGNNEGRQRAEPQLVTRQSLAPGWGGGANAQHGSRCSGPLTPSQNSSRARPPERHCRPAHSHAGTQGHSVTTTLKLRGGREEREKKDFSSVCLLLGTPGAQVGACALGWGRLALKESSRGLVATGWGHPQVLCTRGDAPAQPPIGLDWLMGVGCM